MSRAVRLLSGLFVLVLLPSSVYAQAAIAGVVRDASYLGVSTQYQVESRGGTLTVYEQNVERATRAELWSRGDAVQMTWSPDHSFVVPPDGVDPSEPTGAAAPAPANTTA